MKSKHKRSLECVRHWRAGSIWCRWLFHYDYYLFHCFKCANNNPTSICACNLYVLPNASDLVAAIAMRNTEWSHGILKRKNWELRCGPAPIYRWHYFKIGNHCVIHCFLDVCPRFRSHVSCDSLLKSNVNEYVKKWLISISLKPQMNGAREKAKKRE